MSWWDRIVHPQAATAAAGGALPPPALVAVVDAMARRQLAMDALAVADSQLRQALRTWGAGPLSFTILVDGKEPTGMSIDVSDQQFFVHVTDAKDAMGRVVPDAGPFTYSVVTDTSTLQAQTPSTAATVAADPNHAGDTTYSAVNWAPADPATGTQPNIKVVVSDGTHQGITDVLVPTPGGVATIDLGVSAT